MGEYIAKIKTRSRNLSPKWKIPRARMLYICWFNKPHLLRLNGEVPVDNLDQLDPYFLFHWDTDRNLINVPVTQTVNSKINFQDQ